MSNTFIPSLDFLFNTHYNFILTSIVQFWWPQLCGLWLSGNAGSAFIHSTDLICQLPVLSPMGRCRRLIIPFDILLSSCVTFEIGLKFCQMTYMKHIYHGNHILKSHLLVYLDSSETLDFMVPKGNINQSCRDISMGIGACCQAWLPNWIPGPTWWEGENRFLNVVLWLPHATQDACTCTDTKIQS